MCFTNRVALSLEFEYYGADREAHDRSVNKKTDAVATNEHDDDECLQCFLDEGCYVARVGNELDVEPVEASNVYRIAGDRGDAA